MVLACSFLETHTSNSARKCSGFNSNNKMQPLLEIMLNILSAWSQFYLIATQKVKLLSWLFLQIRELNLEKFSNFPKVYPRSRNKIKWIICDSRTWVLNHKVCCLHYSRNVRKGGLLCDFKTFLIHLNPTGKKLNVKR